MCMSSITGLHVHGHGARDCLVSGIYNSILHAHFPYQLVYRWRQVLTLHELALISAGRCRSYKMNTGIIYSYIV